MLNHRQNEITIVENLKQFLTTPQRPCEIVRQNQIAEIPSYPYVSYTVITPANVHTGTYSETEEGILYRNIQQTWSFTTQSDDQDEALELAYKIFDYFTAAGVQFLADNEIIIRRVGGISPRDNLISIQYEYRNGLDVTFGLLYTIEKPDIETIETVKMGNVQLDKPLNDEELSDLLEKRLEGE